MVHFQNINVGARVEVLWRGEIRRGTVRYTGVLVARSGDWIGVELDDRVGNHSGLHKGVQYFKCKNGHGIFTHATNIRFNSNKRLLFNSYRTISPVSSVDEKLFGRLGEVDDSESSAPDPPVISSNYLKTLFHDNKDRNYWSKAKGFHKSHLVGAHIKPATVSRPQSAAPSTSHRYKDRAEHFISPPSIPCIYVPRPVLKRMIQQDYFGTTVPRYSSLS